MRITGGMARGIRLHLPARGEIRPTTDFLRGAVFSSLGSLVNGARVLDVFAGTGAYGFEALSRGAAHAHFVEKNPAAVTAIGQNAALVAKSCRWEKTARKTAVSTRDMMTWAPPGGVAFDLVFCDPPWALWERLADGLLARVVSWASGANARVVLETPGEFLPTVPEGWCLRRHLARGRNQPAACILGRAEPSSISAIS
ncbi:MAG: RsmD family RNA methyltransferase [Puniceicoccales bacterium]|jgi:16S rRNA (guanine966-N2)-methyltransferase|nr:RsmD family RNA methyltransferase [Puniceicoccales bacterium]